jgi:hypothetical protein
MLGYPNVERRKPGIIAEIIQRSGFAPPGRPKAQITPPLGQRSGLIGH